MPTNKHTAKYPIVFLVYKDIVLWDQQMEKPSTPNKNFPLHIFHVVGFLIEDNPDNYVLAREIVTNQNDDLRGAMTIPKEVVLHFETIKA